MPLKMKIYTKTGDKGLTALLGGERVSKTHLRIEAYGTVDELVAMVGVIRDHIQIQAIIDDLVFIQDQLMVCASILATDDDHNETNTMKLSEEAIVWLEKNIDAMDDKLPPLKRFLLPGGHPAVSFTHLARTICRRAERRIISLSESIVIPGIIIQYFNRLSDYLFVLSRYISHELKVREITWQPKLDK